MPTLARFALCLLVLSALGSLVTAPAGATVLFPDVVVRADDPVRDRATGVIREIPLRVYVREDADVGSPVLAGGGSDLRLEPLAGAEAGESAPEGYRLLRYTLRGRIGPDLEGAAIRVPVGAGEQIERLSFGAAAAESPGMVVADLAPRIARADLAAPEPAPSVRIAGERFETKGTAAPRLVAVTGRILFRDPEGAVFGVDGATVKVMRRVDILDDETLDADVTDVNGDVAFTFAVDGAPDLYIKVEAANGTAVNVGTGLFFSTYSRHIPFDDFAGTQIDLGTRVWGDDFNEALWLTHAITRAHRWSEGYGFDPDRVHVRYPDDSKGVSWYWPAGGLEGIHLRSNRVWSTSTLYHEYGHHFVYQHAAAVSPWYCNGRCEPEGSCGHCYWCEENEAIAWSEGFPHWLAWIMKRDHGDEYGWALPDADPWSTEWIGVCGDDDNSLHRAMSTEGSFTAFLVDLVDETDENDPAFDDTAWDRTRIDPADILHVATVDRPTDAPTFLARMQEFIAARPGFDPVHLVDYWSTVRNNGLDEDTVPPTAPTQVASPTHAVGVASNANMPVLHFYGGTDAFSGVQAHYVTMTPNSPAAPGEGGVEVEGAAMGWPTPLAPGTWYANVRSVDGAGNRSLDHASYGPMIVGAPLPVDLVPHAGGFWENALIVRNTPDATAAAAGWPAELLPGAGYLSLMFRNDSPSAAAVDTFAVGFAKNGLIIAQGHEPAGTLLAGEELWQLNVPVTFDAGRHRFAALLDHDANVGEEDEANNVVGVSVVVRPDEVPAGSWHLRANPPFADGGLALAPETPPNVQGGRFHPTGAFGAVVGRQVDDSGWATPLSLSVFAPATGVADGFATPLASMNLTYYERGSAILVSRSAVGGSAFDFGVARTRPEASGGYHVQTLNSVAVPLGVEFVLNWTEEDARTLLEFTFGPGDLGLCTFTLEPPMKSDGLRQNLECHWMYEGQAALPLGYPSPAYYSQNRDVMIIVVQVSAPGKYCLAVSRSGAIYQDPFEALVVVGKSELNDLPELVVPDYAEGWPAGLIPQVNYAPNDPPSFPLELLGDSQSTYLSFLVENIGLATAASVPVQLFFQGEPLLQFDLGPLAAGERATMRHPNPLNIPAGRRTLVLQLDPEGTVPELTSLNNTFAMQWGWRAASLPFASTVTRPFPPDPYDDLEFVPEIPIPNAAPDGEDGPSVPANRRVPNCDGLRLMTMPFSAVHWYGVAAMPAAGEDIDLNLYRGDAPAALAFVDPIAGSHSPTSEIEFLLVNRPSLDGIPFDVGVVGVAGSTAYTAQAALATVLGDPGGGATYGPYPFEGSTMLRLFDVTLKPGDYQFYVDNLSGEGSFGVSLHPPLSPVRERWHGKDDLARGVASARRPEYGADTILDIYVPPGLEGRWCVAVWKESAADLPVNADIALIVSHAPLPFTIPVDGATEPAYGSALAVQAVPTGFGDSDLGMTDFANGSELNAAYARITDGTLFVTLTGNLESNGNDLEIFLDTRPGGQNRLRGDNAVLPEDPLGRMGDDGSGNGLAFDALFDADWYLTISGGEQPYRLTAAMAELPTGGGGPGAILGSGFAATGGVLYGPSPEIENPYGVRVTIDNSNTGGVGAVWDPNADLTTVITGIEWAIPLAAIGNPAGCIRMTAFINGLAHDFVSNQVLPPLPPGTGLLGEPREIDFAQHPGDQNCIVCPASTAIPGDGDESPRVPSVALRAPSPNPFGAVTTLAFTLREPASVSVGIYDVSGRLVRRLEAGRRFEAGDHRVVWDGTSDAGTRAAAGIYYVRIATGGAAETRAVVLHR